MSDFPIVNLPDMGAHSLPSDIEAYLVKLQIVFRELNEHEKMMDGYFFGYVGADGFISLIPVIGDVISGLITFSVLSKASQVKMPLGGKMLIIGIGTVDVAIGMVPGIGDIADFFFRAHAWNVRQVQSHIEMQITQIETVRRQIVPLGSIANDHPSLSQLRDELFRGGKTKIQSWIRLAAIIALFAGMLSYCHYQETLRQERISICEAKGGWFCSWRN